MMRDQRVSSRAEPLFTREIAPDWPHYLCSSYSAVKLCERTSEDDLTHTTSSSPLINREKTRRGY
eukprot:scaffold3574_cov171-Amphora_coffeaeformis.AAC.2